MSTSPVRLVLSDVDGTLVSSDKSLTDRSVRAIRMLREAGIFFALASARPAQGLRRFIAPLQLSTPLSALNGGLGVDEQMNILYSRPIDEQTASTIIDELLTRSMSVWVYAETEWFVLDEFGPHVQHESKGSDLRPTVLSSFEGIGSGAIKIVGVSDDVAISHDACRAVAQQFGSEINVAPSQAYYLDVTHGDVNKGAVVNYLSQRYEIPRSQIATIGDMSNDVSMFEQSGLSIAMGNAHADVQGAATFTTASNDEEGFALAVEKYILSVAS